MSRRTISLVILIMLSFIAGVLYYRLGLSQATTPDLPMPEETDRYNRYDPAGAGLPASSAAPIETPPEESLSATGPMALPAPLQNRTLQAFELAMRRHPPDGNPDFWLAKAHIQRRSWPSAARCLQSALRRPLHHHLRHVFSYLIAHIELILWLKQQETARTGAYLDAFRTGGSAIPPEWETGTLRAGAGFFLKESRNASETSSATVMIPSPEILAEILSRELVQVASAPESIPTYLMSVQKRYRARCGEVLRLVNKHIPQLEFNQTYAAVDFLYEALRPAAPEGTTGSGPGRGDWFGLFEKEWCTPAVPACQGQRFERMRNRWGCVFHEELVPVESSVLSDQEFAVAEAWAEFFITHPQRVPEPYLPEMNP